MRDFYALLDQKKEGKSSAAFLISQDDAIKLNNEGYGIFWTVNQFDQKPRKKENVVKLLSWHFEIDLGHKSDQIKKINGGPSPSLIIETKRGYHVYFDIYECENDLEEYRSILIDRLVPYYNADPKAADVCRILRVPFFKHMKDPENPFDITIIKQTKNQYTQKEMEKLFPIKTIREKEERVFLKSEMSHIIGDDCFDKMYSMNQAEALQRISGTPAVGMEVFSFRRNTSGYQILVNGKSTSSWIDRNFKIGSYEKGGPTIYQWIKWYHKDDKTVMKYIKEYFPELFEV